MFLTMINNNNTDSYTSTTSNKDIVKLVKDVKQNFKDFLATFLNFKYIS